MAVFRKAKSHLRNIFRLIKNQQCLRRPGEKLIRTLIFSKLLSADGVLRGRNVLHVIKVFFRLRK